MRLETEYEKLTAVEADGLLLFDVQIIVEAVKERLRAEIEWKRLRLDAPESSTPVPPTMANILQMSTDPRLNMMHDALQTGCFLYADKMFRTAAHVLTRNQQAPDGTKWPALIPDTSSEKGLVKTRRLLSDILKVGSHRVIPQARGWTEVKPYALGPMRERAANTAGTWLALMDEEGRAFPKAPDRLTAPDTYTPNVKLVDGEDLGVLTIVGWAAETYPTKPISLITGDFNLSQVAARVWQPTAEEIESNIEGLGQVRFPGQEQAENISVVHAADLRERNRGRQISEGWIRDGAKPLLFGMRRVVLKVKPDELAVGTFTQRRHTPMSHGR